MKWIRRIWLVLTAPLRVLIAQPIVAVIIGIEFGENPVRVYRELFGFFKDYWNGK